MRKSRMFFDKSFNFIIPNGGGAYGVSGKTPCPVTPVVGMVPKIENPEKLRNSYSHSRKNYDNLGFY